MQWLSCVGDAGHALQEDEVMPPQSDDDAAASPETNPVDTLDGHDSCSDSKCGDACDETECSGIWGDPGCPEEVCCDCLPCAPGVLWSINTASAV